MSGHSAISSAENASRSGSWANRSQTRQHIEQNDQSGAAWTVLTMISPSSAFGMLLSWISLTATVSPVAQFRAPSHWHLAPTRRRYHIHARYTWPKAPLPNESPNCYTRHLRQTRNNHRASTNIIIERLRAAGPGTRARCWPWGCCHDDLIWDSWVKICVKTASLV